MAQNISTAVMARRTEAPDSLDFFPTPPWATRALCEHVLPEVLGPGFDLKDMDVWEPACGGGHMIEPLGEYFGNVVASDIHDYGHGAVYDFLADGFLAAPPPFGVVDFVITNPPFNKGAAFVSCALERATIGCAMLVRTAFAEGIDRFQTLFQPVPPLAIAQFVQRVPIVKGRLDKSASSATAYAWFVWLKGHTGHTRMVWIPPCRKDLERGGDYGETAP